MVSIIILVVLFKLAKLSAGELEISPESKTIDVNEGDLYTIRFIEDNTTDIRRCYYISDTISGSFEVVKEEETETKTLNSQLFADEATNTITEFGQAGWCRIDVGNVDVAGPKSWTLVAYDAKTDKNITAEFTVNFYFNVDLLLSKVLVRETGSFVQYTVPSSEVQFTKCVLYFSNRSLSLSLSSKEVAAAFDEENDVVKRVFSLGRGKCGFKLINATKEDPDEFKFVATDEKSNNYRVTFSVGILSQASSRTTKEVTLGETIYLSCGLELPDDQYFCDLYDPSGELVQSDTRCYLPIEMVTINHIGTWKCRIGIPYLMETPVYEVELIQKESQHVATWVEETLDYVNIGCSFNNYESSAFFCRMVAPNQESFKIEAGAATGRYTTLTTDLTSSVCGMEIEKPLEDFEKGVWKCELQLINDAVGGFLRVGVGENVTLEYEKHIRKTIQLGQAFQVECKVSYSTSYCHVKAPNGTIYPTNNRYKTHLGECSLEILESVTSDNGTWICSFAQETGRPDEEIYFEVTIAEVLVYYEQVEVIQGSDAELSCSSGGIPLEYCRFISPQGVAYHLQNETSGTGISYTGGGLEKGECGVRISNVNVSHRGTWTCITRLGSGFRQNEISARIQLEVTEPPASSTTAVAASLGSLGGVLLVVCGVVGYKLYRRRKGRNEAAVSVAFPRNRRASVRSDASSESSGTVIIASEATYNTVNN